MPHSMHDSREMRWMAETRPINPLGTRDMRCVIIDYTESLVINLRDHVPPGYKVLETGISITSVAGDYGRSGLKAYTPQCWTSAGAGLHGNSPPPPSMRDANDCSACATAMGAVCVPPTCAFETRGLDTQDPKLTILVSTMAKRCYDNGGDLCTSCHVGNAIDSHRGSSRCAVDVEVISAFTSGREPCI